MEINIIIGHIFGLIALIVSIISVIQSRRQKYIFFNIIQNIFLGMQYLMLGKNIAFYICLLTIFRLIVYSFKKQYSKRQYVIILILFLILNIVVSIITFDNIFDLFPIVSTIIICYTVWQSNIKVIKIGIILSKTLWCIYACYSLAYFSIIMDIFVIIWTVIFLIVDNNKKNSKHNA